ncbi:MAG: SH3 domain-containing protein, partial [Clostridia bacterium]|nr:SH3 domain-containing protein [Clostridia bacterium]
DPDALLEPTAEMIAGAAQGQLTKSGVNMRQGPSTNTPIIATGLRSGTKLTVYCEDGDFYFLLVNET